MQTLIILIFVLGYLAIAFEHFIRINKTATALVTGVVCWTLFAIAAPDSSLLESNQYTTFVRGLGEATALNADEMYHHFIKSELSHSLSEIASVLFFLMGAMTIVELIDAHDGFRLITDRITTRDLRKLLWIVCWVTFFLSAVLDNLTTAIVMVSLSRKLIPEKETRLFFAGMIIIAANAGGAWSPIGDVTTTMLWIGGQISSPGIIRSILGPSVICLLVPLVYLTFRLKGNIQEDRSAEQTEEGDGKGGKIMLSVGLGALIFVPLFKTITDLPPYMGMLLSLGVLWVVSELINPNLDEIEKKKYSAASALSRIDVSSVLFFFGILLAVGALDAMQTLDHFAGYLANTIGDNRIIITFLGVLSSVIDNVPLVAAGMGMFPMETYPMDHTIWEYLAYCAGTGGSLLVIGSAAGIAVMGMEKMGFMWYLKRMSFLALIGYLGGAGVYLLFNP